MIRLSIDDRVSDLATAPIGRVADIVAQAMATLPADRVLLAVAVDGRPVPKHAEEERLAFDASSVGEIGIRTGDRDFWARSGLDIALSTVERMHHTLIRASELFRDEHVADANRCFVRCLEGLERFLETVVVTRAAMRLDFTTVRVDGCSLAQIEREFLQILRHILHCQEATDWIGIADRVEYELLPNLSSWRTALRSLRLAHASCT
jgi:hypothetical protein